MENLWKKESKSGNYVDLFDDIELTPIANANGLRKHDLISTQLRHKGDQKFVENAWVDAMECYNKSLRFAISVENVSLTYANRAACFLHLKMFDKCLNDIEMSKSENCTSKGLLIKLEKCKAECLKTMKREHQEQFLERKLNYDCHANFPCLADVVEIQCNEQYGRHIVAKCEIPVGKVILVEKSFLSTTLSEKLTGCATCLKTRMNFIACESCTIAMFCDDKCRKSNVSHNYDCNFIYDRDTSYNGQLMMMAQTIFFGMEAFGGVFDEMKRFIEETEEIKVNYVPKSVVDMKSKYRLFLTLAAHTDEFEKKTLLSKAKTLYTILLKLTTVNGMFDTVAKQRFLMHLVTKHVVVTSRNAINATQNQCQRIATLGLIFPLFNHACAPNLLNFTTGDQQICITMRPVQTGEQLFVSYVVADVSTRQRQMHLMKNFGFLCACEKCDPKSKMTDVTNLQSDTGYLFIQRNRNRDLINQQNRQIIKTKCIDLLNKHGRSWFMELEFVLDMYIKCELYEH